MPYEHEWPSRCDEHRTDEPDHWMQSACVMCRYGIEGLPPAIGLMYIFYSNGCDVNIGVKDGKMAAVRGRVSDRVNHGRLGPKAP